MSASKPETLLSFIYNTTCVPAYRTEMHMDMRRAFERLKVVDGAAQDACFEIEKAAYELRTSSSGVAASQPVNVANYAAAKARMAQAAPALFSELVGQIVAMVVAKADFSAVAPLEREIDVNAFSPQVGQEIVGAGPIAFPEWPTLAVADNSEAPGSRHHLLLAFAYYFFHYKSARAAIIKNKMIGFERAARSLAAFSPVPLNKSGQPAIVDTLLELGRMTDSPEPVPAAVIEPLARDLCDLLAVEYEGPGWLACW